VGGVNVVSSESFPSDNIPLFGKLPDHNCPIAWGSPFSGGSKDPWYVLKYHPFCSHFTDNSERFRPEVSLIICTTSKSCDTEGGTRESCCNDVNQSSKLFTPKGRYISEDGCVIEEAVFDSCLDNFLGIFFPFDISHRPYV
jgi:hypothetical protein